MTNYITQERAKYWPITPELMAQYNNGSHTGRHSHSDLYWRNQNGKLHRDGDKPAIIYPTGSLEWRQNGKRHRDEDKPAVIHANGKLQWLKNGKKHRLCGPAIVCSDGELRWWINGENITQEVNYWLNRNPWLGTPEQIVEFQLRFL